MKYALLIDSENAQPRMDEVFQELSKYGDTPIRYVVGDFTKTQISPWLEICKKHAITCIQTINFTNGKNSLDISLVIEGMKILYEKDFIDGIIIVASDSDYTPLAREWRNAGKDVIGIGKKNSTESYRASCNSFIYVENIFGSKDEASKDNSTITPINKLTNVIDSVLNDNNGKALLSIVVSAVRKAYSDFDVRNYGYQKAIDFFKGEFKHVELVKEDQRTYSLQFRQMKPIISEEANKPTKNNKDNRENKKESKKSVKKDKPKKENKNKREPKKATLPEDIKNKIVSLFDEGHKDSLAINDFATILNKNNIKCKSLGFNKLKDMLETIDSLDVNDNTIAKRVAPHVIVEIDEDDSLDF